MTTSAASDAINYGFAATGLLNDGVAEGLFVFVARSAIGVAQQDRISGFRTANEIAPQSLVHAIFVDEDAGQAVWFEDAAGSTQKKKYSIAEMEVRLNSLLYAERPLLGGRLHCMVALQHGQWTVAEEPDAATLESGFEQFRTALFAQCECEGGPTPFATTVGRNYYLPHLHPLLVPSKDNLCESGQIITLRASAFDGQALECCKKNRKPVRAHVEDVFLHLGPERTVLLEWVLALETPAIDSNQTSLWHAILNSGASGPQRSIAAWLDFSASVRTCFKTYSPTEMEKLDRAAKLQLFSKSGKGTAPFFVHAEAIDDGGSFRAPIIGLVEHYLRGFVPLEQAEDLNAILEFRFDERARVIQSVLVAGQDVADDDPNERQRAICEALLQGVDGWNSDFLYAEGYSRDETNRHAYDRYKGKGSRYLISDHSFAYVGHGSFAASDVWPKHMRCSYPPMVRLLHMNGAILNGFSRELANFGLEWTLDPPDDPEKPYPLAKKFARLKGRYLRFLSLNWFEQVSSQLQGVELYDLLRGASHAQRELGVVGESIERAEAFVDQQARNREGTLENRKEDRVRFIATVLPVLGLGGLLLKMLGAERPSGLEAILQNAINRTLGSGAALVWRYELAAYAMMATLLVLGLLGAVRTPQAEKGQGSKVSSLTFFTLAAGTAMAGPLLIHASRADCQTWLLIVYSVVAGGLAYRSEERRVGKECCR